MSHIDEQQELPRKRSRQPKTAEERFYNTVQGYIIKTIEKHGPLEEDTIVSLLQSKLTQLRKRDGNLYKGDIQSIVSGALNSYQLFNKIRNQWCIRQSGAERYKQKVIESIDRRLSRQLSKKKAVQQTIELDNKNQLLVMIERFTRKLYQDPILKKIINNPFPNFTGQEDLQEALQLVGRERLVGVIQGYCLLKKVQKQTDQDLKHKKRLLSLQAGESLLESINSRLDSLEKSLIKIE